MGLKRSAEGLGKLLGIPLQRVACGYTAFGIGQLRSFWRLLSGHGVLLAAAALTGCNGAASNSSSGNAASTTSSTSASSSSTTSNTANPSVALSSSYYAVTPASSSIVTVYRMGSSAGAATVGYSTINGTAIAGT